jgi:hypothetical protein
MNSVKNKYIQARVVDKKVVGGIYKKFHRKIKKYL